MIIKYSSDCYRIGANIAIISFTEFDAKILTKILKVRTFDSNALLQSYAIQPTPPNKPCISLRVFLFLSYRVSLAEYILVLRVLSHHVVGEVLGLLKMVAKCR